MVKILRLINLTHEKSHVDYHSDLKKRLENLSKDNISLRFPVATALNQTRSAIIILFNDAEGYVFVEYKRKPIDNIIEEIVPIPEGRERLVTKYVERKLCLEVMSTPITIDVPKIVPNTHPDLFGEDFYKYTTLVTGMKGEAKEEAGLWVKVDLLPYIFAPEGNIPHPQVYAYNKFKEYLKFLY